MVPSVMNSFRLPTRASQKMTVPAASKQKPTNPTTTCITYSAPKIVKVSSPRAKTGLITVKLGAPVPKKKAPTKQVSFKDGSRTNSNPKLAETPPLPNSENASPLTLTSKNLDMYNTLVMSSTLSLPSDEEDRTSLWVKQRLNNPGEQICHVISEIDEEHIPYQDTSSTSDI